MNKLMYNPRKDVRRTKIELKEDHSLDMRIPSSPAEKSSLDSTKHSIISGDTMKKIFSFNKYIGEAFMTLIQNQQELVKIVNDLVGDLTTMKSGERYTKLMNTENFHNERFHPSGFLSDPASPQGTSKNQRGFIPIKLEKIEKELSNLVSYGHENKVKFPSFAKSNAGSPPPSSRGYDGTLKRQSMPQISDSKKKEVKTEISPLRRLSPTSPKVVPQEKPSKTGAKVMKTIIGVKSKAVQMESSKDSKIKSHRNMGIRSFDTGAFRNEAARLTQSPGSNPSTARNFDKHPSIGENRTPFRVYRPESVERMPPIKEVLMKKNESFENRFEVKPISPELPQKQILDESYLENNPPSHSKDTSRLNPNETDRTFRNGDDYQVSTPIVYGSGNPRKERETIRAFIKMEHGPHSTHPKADDGLIHERKYLIDAKWWRAWKDFVNFDGDEAGKCIKNQNVLSIAFDLKQYGSPGKIVNRGLLRNEILMDLNNIPTELELKENLLEHHDYIAVGARIFDVLNKWYGCDFELFRHLKPDPFRNNKLFLDLYPVKNKPKTANTIENKRYNMVGHDNKVINGIINSNISNNMKKKK